MKDNSKKSENTFSALDFLMTFESKKEDHKPSISEDNLKTSLSDCNLSNFPINSQIEQAEKIWKEKETQSNDSVLSDVKFNPITGTFDTVISGIKFNPLTGGFDFSDSLLKDLKNGVINEAIEEKVNHEIQKNTILEQPQAVVKKVDESSYKQKTYSSSTLNIGSLGGLVLDLLKTKSSNDFTEKDFEPLVNNTNENNTPSVIPTVEKNKLPLDKPVFNPEKPLPINTSKGVPILSKVNKPDFPKLMPSTVNPNEVVKNKGINVSTTIEYSDKEKSELKNLFVINEDNGVFLDITLSTTKKEDAINILNQHCKSKYSTTTIDNVLFYEDKGINLYLENNVVKELEFKGKFDGHTTKGLKLGDTIEQAIKLYGKPTIMTNKGAVWRNIKVFLDKNMINSIKIHK